MTEPQLQLHDLKPAPGSRRRRTRVGRGTAGKRGKTAGRGTKGLKARSKLRPGFEGGQTPLSMRIPKLRGFKNPGKVAFALINVGGLTVFPAGSTVGPDELRSRGLVKHHGQVKVLGEGELDRPLRVRAHAFSAGALAKIEAAGGSIETIGS